MPHGCDNGCETTFALMVLRLSRPLLWLRWPQQPQQPIQCGKAGHILSTTFWVNNGVKERQKARLFVVSTTASSRWKSSVYLLLKA